MVFWLTLIGYAFELIRTIKCTATTAFPVSCSTCYHESNMKGINKEPCGHTRDLIYDHRLQCTMWIKTTEPKFAGSNVSRASHVI